MASQLNPRAKQIMEMAKAKGVEICLPVDFVVSNKFGEDGEIKVTTKAEVRRPLHKPSTLNPQPSTLNPSSESTIGCPGRGKTCGQTYLTESVYKVVLKKSIPPQIHQLILHHY